MNKPLRCPGFTSLTLLTALLLLIFAVVPKGDAAKAAFKKGSLIVAVPCHDGLLIVADKLITMAPWGRIAGAKKILQADQYTIVGSVGAISLLVIKPKPGGTYEPTTTLFDASVSSQRFFQENRTQGSVYPLRHQLATVIAGDFTKALSSLPFSMWPPESPDHFLFESVVCHYDPSSRHFEVMTIPFYFYKQPPSIGVKGPPVTFPADSLEESKALWFGNKAIVGQLKTGQEYQEYDHDRLLEQVTGSPRPRNDMSLSMALRAASRIVTIASLKLPANAPFPVGTHVDAAVLTPSGVRWLYNNVSTDYLDTGLAPLIHAAPPMIR